MISGSYVAMVTPFREREIDYNAVEKLLEFHLDHHTNGILLCGTTGESPALAGDEKESFIRFCLKRCKGRLPLMMGTGTNNLSHSISLTRKAQEMGLDHALVITPYYNKPTQKGLYEYFSKIAASVDIPIIIYNVPGRTGINIEAETVARLAHEYDNICGIKEASGNLVQVSEIIRDAPEGFSLMSGEDALNYPILCCGGRGVISVTANIVPDKVSDLTRYCLKGEMKKALDIHQELLKINRTLFIETNPIPVKEAMAMMGMIKNEFRPPMCELTPGSKVILKNVLEQYNLI